MNQEKKKNLLADFLSLWSEDCNWIIIPMLIFIIGITFTPTACDNKDGCFMNPFIFPQMKMLERPPSSGIPMSSQSAEMMNIVANNATATVSSGSPFAGYTIANKRF